MKKKRRKKKKKNKMKKKMTWSKYAFPQLQQEDNFFLVIKVIKINFSLGLNKSRKTLICRDMTSKN